MIFEENHIVNIGEVRILKNPDDVVWTILGSCVTVIFKARDNLALFSHSIYPSPRECNSKCSNLCPLPCVVSFNNLETFKYVSCSLEYMIAYLKRNNVNLSNVHTSLIGGASRSVIQGQKSTAIQNISKAKEILNMHGIKINREITGGNDGYTLWYYIKNNQIKYKRHEKKEFFVV